MKLQTQIPLVKQSNNLIDYNSKVLLLGSCFVENIGNKLEYFKFQSLQNPFGILFHPKAVEKLIHNSLHKKIYTEEDIFFHNERWHSYDAHSQLSNGSKEQLLLNLNAAIRSAHQQILGSTHIIITLGTAWVYKYYKTNLPVANCHKVPHKDFVKHLLSVEEVGDSLKMMVQEIYQSNPNTTIIFTVSPVRHIKDGFVENSQSKAHLIAGIHSVLNSNSESVNRKSFYFPSYEIMMDELRDYRFYSEDMIHPNPTAVNYIWKRFQEVWISDESLKTMNDVDIIQKDLQHRPFNLGSEAHQQFLQKLELKKQKLQKKLPNISF